MNDKSTINTMILYRGGYHHVTFITFQYSKFYVYLGQDANFICSFNKCFLCILHALPA